MTIDADLHIHTTASDGELTPQEVVARGSQAHLKALSITDHDTVDSVAAAVEEGKRRGVQVIPGIEISCIYKGDEVHILGYFIHIKNPALVSLLETLKESRRERMQKMLAKAVAMGFEVTLADIESREGVQGRAHLAKALVKKGIVQNVREAFTRYLSIHGPLYVERYPISPKNIIQAVQSAGGVTSLAHPGLLKKREIIKEMIALGIEGLEVYYPLHTKNVRRYLLDLTTKHGLTPTGGSDFHGPRTNESEIGMAGVPCARVKELEIKAKVKKDFCNL